ncbi:hypothetical protein S83_003164 [Arachis hypogaea]
MPPSRPRATSRIRQRFGPDCRSAVVPPTCEQSGGSDSHPQCAAASTCRCRSAIKASLLCSEERIILTKNNTVDKLVEIDEIGFGFLRLVLDWAVKQAIIVHLAESYDVETRTLIVDVGNIRLNAEVIGRVFDIPSCGKFHFSN